MRMKLIFSLLTLCIIAVACNERTTFLPNLFDKDLHDFAGNCTLYHNINVTSPVGVCGAQRPTYSYYDAANNWSLYCCTFGPECELQTTNNTASICTDSTATNRTSTLFYEDGWRALCCNEEGMNCYRDNTVDVTDPNTICNTGYDLKTISSNHMSSWNVVCCTEGLA